MRPMSWYCGSQLTTTVSSPASNSDVICQRLCDMFLAACLFEEETYAWEIMTPFGSEVDPDVNCRNLEQKVTKGDAGPDATPLFGS